MYRQDSRCGGAKTDGKERVDMDICGDNRFEIIERAKKHLLDATNIDTSPKEMEVLDVFLFRCWQMGWLDRYDTADTPQTSGVVWTENDMPTPTSYSTSASTADTPQTDCGWK